MRPQCLQFESNTEAAAPEPEIQPEEPTVEVRPLEETVPFEEPVAAEADQRNTHLHRTASDTDS